MINQERPTLFLVFVVSFFCFCFFNSVSFFVCFLTASYLIVCYFPCGLEHILVHSKLAFSFISQQQCYANLVPNPEALSDLSWKVKQKLALTKHDIETVSKTTLRKLLREGVECIWAFVSTEIPPGTETAADMCVQHVCVCACFRF